jgi:hypothetical protein
MAGPDQGEQVTLAYRYQRDYFGTPGDRVIIESDGLCAGPHWAWQWADEDDTSRGGRNADRPPATLAHVGFEIVAQVLAAPLRRAWREHFYLPHAGDVLAAGYFPQRGDCPECRRLEAMLPEGDRPVAYA